MDNWTTCYVLPAATLLLSVTRSNYMIRPRCSQPDPIAADCCYQLFGFARKDPQTSPRPSMLSTVSSCSTRSLNSAAGDVGGDDGAPQSCLDVLPIVEGGILLRSEPVSLFLLFDPSMAVLVQPAYSLIFHLKISPTLCSSHAHSSHCLLLIALPFS
jgi:hypothetical protein